MRYLGQIGVLPVATGLLWGLGLVKVGLSSSFPTAPFQLSEASQFGMLPAFVVTFFFLAPKMRNDRGFFEKPVVIFLFGLLFSLGSIQFLFPVYSDAITFAQVAIGSAMHSSGNVFYLCSLSVEHVKLNAPARGGALLTGGLVALLFFSFLACLPPEVTRAMFVIGLLAFILIHSLARGSFVCSADGDVSYEPSLRQSVMLYAVYGCCLGCAHAVTHDMQGGSSGAFLFVLGAAVSLLVFLVLCRKNSKQEMVAYRTVASAIVLIGAVSLMPLGISSSSLLSLLMTASWLAFWAFLFLTVPGTDKANPILVIVGCFAASRVALGVMADLLPATPAEPLVVLNVVSAILAVAVPAFVIISTLGSSIVDGMEQSETEGFSLDGACDCLAKRYSLTIREREVLRLLAEGRGVARISETLVISEGTAKTHVKHIYSKLGVHSREGLLDLVHRSNQAEGTNVF